MFESPSELVRHYFTDPLPNTQDGPVRLKCGLHI